MKMLKKFAWWITRFFEPYCEIDEVELVTYLILHVSSLAIPKDKMRVLAPIRGTCGTVKIRGTCLPIFSYLIFEKNIMQFIEVTVEVSKPDRIEYISRIKSTDDDCNGQVIEMKEKYKIPFKVLVGNLYKYFPLVWEEDKNSPGWQERKMDERTSDSISKMV